MPILTAQQYTSNRQNYDYSSPNTEITILRSGTVRTDSFIGIYSGNPEPGGISMRAFEALVSSVFNDCAHVGYESLTENQHHNLKQVSGAIVHWKMASQGGRAKRARENMLKKWNGATAQQLLQAYIRHIHHPSNPSVKDFQIGGVRIATASAFLRFLFPDHYGIVDSRVTGQHTNPAGLTTFSLRPNDNYINDLKSNQVEYNTVYTALLKSEAAWLNGIPAPFIDNDPVVTGPQLWRPCDVEMALFSEGPGNGNQLLEYV